MTKPETQLSSGNLAKLAKGTGMMGIGNILGKGSQIATQIILARLLGPAEFGLYALGMAFIRITGMLAPLGLGLGVIRYVNIFRGESPAKLKGVVLQSIQIALAIGFSLGIALFFSASFIAENIFQKPELTPVLRWLSIAIGFASALRVSASATRATGRMQYSVIAYDAGLHVVHLILTVLLVWFWAGAVMGAVYARILSFIVCFVWALYFVIRLFPALTDQSIKAEYSVREVLTYSIATAWVGVISSMMAWTDRFLIGYFRPAVEVGVYQAANQIAMSILIIPLTIGATLTPMIAALHSGGEMKQLNALYKISTKWAVNLSFPILLTIWIGGESLMRLIFGESYVTGTSVMLLLSTSTVLRQAIGVAGLILLMTGYQNRWAILTLIMLLTDIVLNIFLIPEYGMMGAAIAKAISTVGLSITGMIYLFIKLKLFPYDLKLIKGVFAALITFLGVQLVKTADIQSPFLLVFSAFSVSCLLFFGTLYLMGIDNEEQEILKKIRVKLLGANGSAKFDLPDDE